VLQFLRRGRLVRTTLAAENVIGNFAGKNIDQSVIYYNIVVRKLFRRRRVITWEESSWAERYFAESKDLVEKWVNRWFCKRHESRLAPSHPYHNRL